MEALINAAKQEGEPRKDRAKGLFVRCAIEMIVN
jgi:hypothetical protein